MLRCVDLPYCVYCVRRRALPQMFHQALLAALSDAGRTGVQGKARFRRRQRSAPRFTCGSRMLPLSIFQPPPCLTTT